jgi:hypothetical protein
MTHECHLHSHGRRSCPVMVRENIASGAASCPGGRANSAVGVRSSSPPPISAMPWIGYLRTRHGEPLPNCIEAHAAGRFAGVEVDHGQPRQPSPCVRGAAGRLRYLLDEERKRLLAACRASDEPRLHAFVVVALGTGARQGELAACRRWARVKFLFPRASESSRILWIAEEAILSDWRSAEGGDGALQTGPVSVQDSGNLRLTGRSR